MRINPIAQQTNYLSSKITKKNKNSQVATQTNSITDLNVLNRTYNQALINFKAVPTNSLELVKKIPVEERIASILEYFKLGDLLLVGKDLHESAKKMYKTEELGRNAIKRSFFIPDDNLGGVLGFVKNSLGDNEIVNLNDFEIPFITGNKTYPLKPNESFYITDGDTIAIDGKLIPLRTKPKGNISAFRKSFAKTIDYTKEVEPKIEELNKKTLSKMMVVKAKNGSNVSFADVGGLDKLKDELKKDIIYPIRYPEAYENIDVNHGCILYGPPGTGKTHIARALANEAGANFISLNGLDLESKWVGESEENWRNLFKEAKENQPTIIFLDEFDAVAKNRSGKDEYGDKVVNQILTLMTDIDNEGDDVFVVAATNNYKALDKAIIRAGRFGKHYKVDTPDLDGLREIFKIKAKDKPVDENVDVENMLKRLEKQKATGADIRLIVNEAHNHGYVRAGIFDKMEKRTFNKDDISNFKIIQEDFDAAIEAFEKDKNATVRTPIGYNK